MEWIIHFGIAVVPDVKIRIDDSCVLLIDDACIDGSVFGQAVKMLLRL